MMGRTQYGDCAVCKIHWWRFDSFIPKCPKCGGHTKYPTSNLGWPVWKVEEWEKVQKLKRMTVKVTIHKDAPAFIPQPFAQPLLCDGGPFHGQKVDSLPPATGWFFSDRGYYERDGGRAIWIASEPEQNA